MTAGICGNCGQAGNLYRWAAEDRITEALEQLGYRAMLVCDACRTCFVCNRLVERGQGAPASANLKALHLVCLRSPAAAEYAAKLRHMLRGSPDPTTPAELEEWLTANASDIPFMIWSGEGPRRVTLAQLERDDPTEARRWREVIRERWECDRWLPTLISDVQRAIREGRAIQYVSPAKDEPS